MTKRPPRNPADELHRPGSTHTERFSHLPSLQALTKRIQQRPYLAALEVLSLSVAMLPTLLWLGGWLRPWIAVPILLISFYGFWHAFRFGIADEGTSPPDSASGPQITGIHVLRGLGIVGLVCFLVACTGMAGLGFPFFDTVLLAGPTKDFWAMPWPIGYEFSTPNGERVEFSPAYYCGYHLVPGFFGANLDWATFYRGHFLWIALSILLTVTWYLRTIRRFSIGMAVIFLCFGGLDIVGHLLTARYGETPNTNFWDYLTGVYPWSIGRGWLDHWQASFAITEGAEFMNGVFYKSYAALSTLVDGVYHAVPVWIPITMIFYDTLVRKRADRLLLLAAMVPISSMMCAIGLLPFLPLAVWFTRAKGLVNFSNLVTAPCIVFMLFLYFQSNEFAFKHGWIWEYQDFQRAWPYLLLHYIVEFGIVVFALPRIAPEWQFRQRTWLTACILVFVAVPLYRLGEFSDFAFRAHIPAQILFLIIVGIALSHNRDTKLDRIRKRLLIALLIVGMWGSAGIILRSLEYGIYNPVPPEQQIRSVPERLPDVFLAHAQSDADSFFWRYLGNQPEWNPMPPIDSVVQWDYTDSAAYQEKGWDVQQPYARVTAEGLEIPVEESGYILELRDANLHARDIGTILIALEETGIRANDGHYLLVLQWADSATAMDENPNPLHTRWRSHILHPHERSVNSNAYWRGEIARLNIYLQVLPTAPKNGQITIKNLTAYER